jgi:predicted nucleotidyltransferase
MMVAVRRQDTPLDRLLARRAQLRLQTVAPQVEATLAAIRAAGVLVDVFGSYARGEFRISSDVDFLVSDRGTLTESAIYAVAFEHMTGTRFDLVFADRVAPGTLELMRGDSRRRDDAVSGEHPVLLIVRAKIRAMEEVFGRCDVLAQGLLGNLEPGPRAVHARAVAFNVIRISWQLMAILKTLAVAIDGFAPAGSDEAQADLLLQAAATTEHRTAMIGPETERDLGELLALRDTFDGEDYEHESEHSQDQIAGSLALTRRVVPEFLAQLDEFLALWE